MKSSGSCPLTQCSRKLSGEYLSRAMTPSVIGSYWLHTSDSPHMQRVERYKNVLRMIHRVHELQDKHRWNTAQFRKAMSLLDETHPFSLHLTGTYSQIFLSKSSHTRIYSVWAGFLCPSIPRASSRIRGLGRQRWYNWVRCPAPSIQGIYIHNLVKGVICKPN